MLIKTTGFLNASRLCEW